MMPRTGIVWLVALAAAIAPSGTSRAQDSNSASVRFGYLGSGERGMHHGAWAIAADLFVNLTTGFGLGLELGMSRVAGQDVGDAYYQAVLMARHRETWGAVRPYVSGGGGLYLLREDRTRGGGTAVIPLFEPHALRPNSPPPGNPHPAGNAYSANLGGNFGLGAEFDILPGPVFLEADLRGHLVLATFVQPRWLVASIGLGIDWKGREPG